MTKARDLANLIAAGNTLADGAISVAEISDLTASAAELNTLDGITATTEELNNVAGVNSDVQTQLDGKQAIVAGVSDAEIGYLDGVTSNLQTQLDNISVTSGSLTKSFLSGETASITLAQAISPAPVVSVTKEVAQAGVSSKGAWDVNATASNYELHNTAYDTTLTPGSALVASNVSGASYDSVSFSVASQQGDPQGCTFGDSGNKLYVAGKIPQAVHQYNLTTAYDISTASYASKVLDTSSYTSNTRTVVFKSDGSVAYVLDDSNSQIDIYNLSTAWDISTASYSSNFSLSGEAGRGLAVKPDGTKFYFGGGRDVREYTLTSAWDLTTASLTHTAGSITISELAEIALSSDGSRLYILNRSNSNIEDYTLSTAYDLSTVSAQVSTFSIASQDSDEQGIMLNGDDTKLFMIGKTSDLIYQYTNPTSSSPALVLGTGSFASTDVGKRIQGNGGDVTLTSTAGAYDTTGGSAFTDSSTIASGSWSMRGLKSAGDADGIGLAGYINQVATATGDTIDTRPDGVGSTQGIFFKPDGTRFFIVDNDDDVHEFRLSTAWDLSTAQHQAVISSGDLAPRAITFSSDGTYMYVVGLIQSGVGNFNYKVYQFNLGTAWGIQTANAQNNWQYSTNTDAVGMQMGHDGTYFFLLFPNTNSIRKLNLSSPYNIGSASYAGSSYDFTGLNNADVTSGSATDMNFNTSGTKVWVCHNDGTVCSYTLSTAWDVSTASYDGVAYDTGQSAVASVFVDSDTTLYVTNNSTDVVHEYTLGTTVVPTSQYHIAATNSGGQINSSTWIDINSMTADQAAGDGTVHYAVSTDDRTTWSVAKASDGVRPIVRDNAGTWQYNNASTYAGTTWVNGSTNDEFYTLQESLGDGIAEAAGTFSSLSNVTYDSVDFAVGSQDADPRGVAFSTDGTKMFVAGNSGDSIYQYTLSTAHDISTATYNSSFAAQGTNVLDVVFNSDGTKMYAPSVSPSPSSIYEYDLSTAFDITTVTYNSVSLNISSQSTGTVHGISFNDDGTKLYTAISGSSVYEYVLSTAYDLSTASYNNLVFNAQSQVSDISGVTFNSDGTKMFISDNGTDAVYQYSLNTPFSIGTVTYDNVSISLSSQDSDIEGVTFSSDFTKMYIAGSSNNKIYQYSTGLTVSNHNRMDKTQLDAVADGSHFTLGDTLDLAIALRQDTASASTPKSDGVSINYDAAALNQGAVLGTDYDYDFPNSTTVRVTSNAAQNLKIRVV